jgi:hypothetical protein
MTPLAQPWPGTCVAECPPVRHDWSETQSRYHWKRPPHDYRSRQSWDRTPGADEKSEPLPERRRQPLPNEVVGRTRRGKFAQSRLMTRDRIHAVGWCTICNSLNCLGHAMTRASQELRSDIPEDGRRIGPGRYRQFADAERLLHDPTCTLVGETAEFISAPSARSAAGSPLSSRRRSS